MQIRVTKINNNKSNFFCKNLLALYQRFISSIKSPEEQDKQRSLTSIVTVLVKTDEDMITLQLLFCKLQQKGKTVTRQSKQKNVNVSHNTNMFCKKIIIHHG